MDSPNSTTIGEITTSGKHYIRVLLYSYTPILFSSGSISTWRATERFFAKFFGFLFDNTSQCYLVFASLFPTLKLYFISLIMDAVKL